MSSSRMYRTALSALSSVSNGCKPMSVPPYSLSAKSSLSAPRSRASHGISSRHGDANSRTPFPTSTFPASNGKSSGDRRSATSYRQNLDPTELHFSSPVLDGMESVYSMGPASRPSESHKSSARITHEGRSPEATNPSMIDSVSVQHKHDLVPQDSPLLCSDETPAPSTKNPTKPPHSSITIPSVGSDGSKDSRQIKLHGEPVFATLYKKWGRSDPEQYVS